MFQHFFLDFSLHFLPDPYGIRGFQLNVGQYDHFIFVIFVWILWDCRDFEHRFTGILWNCNFKIEDYGKKEDSGQKSLCMVRDYFV